MIYVAIFLVLALVAVIYQNASVIEVNTREEKVEFYNGCLSTMTLNELKAELDSYRSNRKYKPQYVFMGDVDLFMTMLKEEVNLRAPTHNTSARETIAMEPSTHASLSGV